MPPIPCKTDTKIPSLSLFKSRVQHHTGTSHFNTNTALPVSQTELDTELEALTSEQASAEVQSLGLTHIYAGLESPPAAGTPLSHQPGLGEAAVRQFLQRLDVLLASPDMLTLPQLRLLASSAHRLAVQRRSAEVVGVIYEKLYKAVHEPGNGYAEPEKLMPRPPDQLKALLVI